MRALYAFSRQAVTTVLVILALAGSLAPTLVVAEDWTLRALNARLVSVAGSGTQHVAVLDNGTLFHSPDGAVWKQAAVIGGQSTFSGSSVVWSGTQFVAVGSGGGIHTSADGMTWTPRASGTSQSLGAVLWTGAQFVAVGAGGTILTSPDGITWTSRTSGTANQLLDVTWSGTQYVAVGFSTVLSSPDAVTWTVTSTSMSAQSVASSGSLFVAVTGTGASGSPLIYTSPDGGTWTQASPGTGYSLTRVLWSGTQFVAVGDANLNFSNGQFMGPGTILTSPDGINWTSRSAGAIGPLFGATWTGTQYLAVGGHTTTGSLILTSPDSVTWSQRLVGTNNQSHTFQGLYGIAWSGIQYVAAGDQGAVRTSSDGIAWTSRNSGVTNTLNAVAWSGTLFAAAMANGGILTSPDAITWTVRATGNVESLNGLAWSGTQFLAVGSGGRVLTSPDGISWTSRTSGTGQGLNAATWSGTQFVAVGANGTVLTSPDGATWTSRTSGLGSHLNAVVWSGTQFAVVGNNGLAATSPDGITWTSRTPFVGINLHGVSWSGSQFVAAGGLGCGNCDTIFSSADGITWTRSLPGIGLAAVVWSGSQFVAAGTYGIIQTTGSGAPPGTLSVRSGAAAGTINGIVYLAGGNDGSPRSDLFSYDPLTANWTSVHMGMPGPRYEGNGTRVINGKLYVPGGWTHVPPLPNSNLWEYDPVTNIWVVRASMPVLSGCGVSGVINDKLYVATSCDGNSGYRSFLHVWDPAKNTWAPLPDSAFAHGSSAGGVIGGKLYVVGGQNSAGNARTANLEAYDPAANAWTTLAPMPTARDGMAAVVIGGKLVVAGGATASGVTNIVEIYDPQANSWSIGTPIPTARSLAASAVVGNIGYFIGGRLDGGAPSNIVDAYTLPGLDTTAPAVPGGLTATSVTINSVTLRWAVAVDNLGVTNYQIYRNAVLLATVNAPALTHTDSGLSAATSYSYTVTACDAAGNCSAQSAALPVTTQTPPDTQAPSIPSGVGSIAVTSTQVTVGWLASTDNVGVTNYQIYRGGVLRATVSAPVLSFTDTGLAASTAYSYTVAACDAAVNCSAQSVAAVVATTAPDAIYSAALVQGFNLIGNALNVPLDVATVFGNADTMVSGVTPRIFSIWKWNAVEQRWAFHSPRLTRSANAAFVAAKGYDVLTTINPGEGYWVNAIANVSLPAQSGPGLFWFGAGASVQLPNNFSILPQGFNLLAHAGSVTPGQFNADVSLVLPSAGAVPTGNFLSLWAWDAVAGRWFFYAPELDSAGGLPAVKAYADSNFYRHFQDYDKTLGIGVGFWVNVTGGLTLHGLSVGQSGTGMGTIAANPSGPGYVGGTVVTLTASADAGSVFAGWSGACVGVAATCAVTMDASKAVTATFNLVPVSYTLSIATLGTGSGSVSGNPAGPSYASGTVVTLTANPAAGSAFAGWSGGCFGDATTCTVTMDVSKSVTATFGLVPVSYTLTTATSGSGSGNVRADPAGPSYTSGTVVTLTATPDAGSTFAGWSGSCTGNSTTCTVAMNANRFVTANWDEQAPPFVQLSALSVMAAMPFTSLTISGIGLAQATAGVSVRFIPNNGNPAITVPVSAPSSTSLQVIVPPLFDSTSNNPISGTVDVQVIRVSDTTLVASNLISGFEILALAPGATGTPVGSKTATFLVAVSDIFSNAQSSLSSDPTLSQVASSSPNYALNLNALISAINTVTTNPSASVSLNTANGSTVILDARTIALSDRIVQGLIAQLAGEAQAPATLSTLRAMSFITQTSSTCPLYPNDPLAYDTNLCHVQRFFQNMTENPAVTSKMTKALASMMFGFIPVGNFLSNQVLAGGLWTLGYSFLTTGKPPPGGDIVEDLTTSTMDAWGNTSGMIGFAYSAFDVFRLAATTFPSRRGAAPVAMAISDPTGNAYLLLRDGSALVTVPVTQGSFPIDSLKLVTSAPLVTGLVCSPASIVVPSSGTLPTITCTVTINPASGASVQVPLINSAPAVLGVPDSVTVPANQTSVTFNVTALAAGTASITAGAMTIHVEATAAPTPSYCACAFDVFSTAFGPGGAWICRNTSSSQLAGNVVTPGACQCRADLFQVCQ